jgi:hypothetical protein
MTAEIEHDETPNGIAKELLELGLIHEVRRIKRSFKWTPGERGALKWRKSVTL